MGAATIYGDGQEGTIMTSLSQDGSASVIIEAAINGQTTVATNPHVPRSSAELASDALACLEVGAAIIHSHITDIAVPPPSPIARGS